MTGLAMEGRRQVGRLEGGMLTRDPAVTSEGSWPSEPFVEPTGSLLRGYERYRTADPERAEKVIASFLSPHRLTVHAGDGRFAAVGNVAEAGAISLCLMSYGQEVAVDRPAQDDPYLAVLIPIRGRLLVRVKNTDFVATPRDCAATLSQGDGVRLLWSADSWVLTLRADATALRAALLGLSPRADRAALKFDSAKLVGAQRQALLGVAATLMHAFNSCRTDGGLPRLLARRLSEHALSTMLVTIGHSHTAELFYPSGPASSRSVRAVLDLIHDEERAEYTVSDLAAKLGVTTRALELAFRKELDTTPNAYLLRARLERAHEELCRGDARDGTTVTDIAMKWGFAHTGRFAKRYRQVFGVAPSTQLHSPAC
ncbi:AraC family transcriptional regulator [Mycolicibacterium cosmeticum]|uniref:AraC family transcriptional regulator n=2 Tax=Mycobacteriaceae TaxID=1762 RepID=UPI003204E6C7